MPLWTWALTLLKGFLPIDGKRIGKIIWLIVWIVLVLTVYNKVFFSKQSITRIEKIETQIVNACPKQTAFLGIKLWKVKLGVDVE